MTHDLIVPAQVTALHIERQYRCGVEVVATACLAAKHRHGVAGHVIDETQLRVGVGDVPHPGAALLPDVPVLALLRPGLAPRLTRSRNGPEVPEDVAGVGVEGDHLPAKRPVAVRQPREHLAVHVDRRPRDRLSLAGRVVADLRRPLESTSGLAERGHTPIHQADEDLAVSERDTRWRRNAPDGVQDVADAGPLEVRRRILIRLHRPDLCTGRGVARVEPGSRTDEQHAVLHDRGRAGRRATVKGERPRRAERGHGAAIDLVQCGIPGIGPISANEGPVGVTKLATIPSGLCRDCPGQHAQRDDRRRERPAQSGTQTTLQNDTLLASGFRRRASGAYLLVRSAHGKAKDGEALRLLLTSDFCERSPLHSAQQVQLPGTVAHLFDRDPHRVEQ